MYHSDLLDIIRSEPISDNLHGGNFVATVNSVRPEDSFTDVANAIGLSSLRFPGGDLTERFLGPNSPSWDAWVSSSEPTITLSNGRELTTVRSFIQEAINQNLEVSIVLPTEGLLIRNEDGSISIDEIALDKAVQLATDLVTGTYGNVRVTQFEIGNEYYVDGRLSAEEYGLIANSVSQALGEAFEEVAQSRPFGLLHEPDILVQAGPPWQEGDNQAIIDALVPEARAYIDGVIVHWYPRNLERIDALRNHFEAIDLWQESEGLENVELHVTEWNIFNSPLADTGLNQASALIEAYETLATENVASADIWGISFPRLLTRLAVPNRNDGVSDPHEYDDVTLTPAGEVIRSLFATTAGLHVIDLQVSQVIDNASILGTENIDHSISAFGNEDRAVIYISQRTDEQLDLRLAADEYLGGAHHIIVQTYEAIDNYATANDEANPEYTDRVQVVTRTYSADEFDDIIIRLDPGEIARIEFAYGNTGVWIEGQVSSPDSRFDYHDLFEGSTHDDTIFGHSGNDAILGGGGSDLLYGGADDDRVFGNFGRDVIFGGSGNDSLFGGNNADVFVGGSGGDRVNGGQEDDLIFGGSGSNVLSGDGGNDTLVSTGDDDELIGGEGRDTFSVSVTGNSIIEDWSYESGDQISFQGQYETPDEVRNRMVEVNYSDGRSGDLVIEHDNGTSTVIRGAAGQQEAVSERLFDHQPLGANTLNQANLLNSLSPPQVTAIIEVLGSAEYEAYLSSIDSTLLVQNLSGGQLSGFLNGLDGVEARSFIQSISEDARDEMLREMSPAELNEFLSTLGYEQAIALLQEVDGSLMAELSPSFDQNTSAHVEQVIARVFSDLERETSAGAESALEDTDWIDQMLNPNNQPVGPPPPSDIDANDGDDENNPGQPQIPGGQESADGASCFIATVVYADPNHPDVWLLRWYRDEVLRKSSFGRLLISLYWLLGPSLAKMIGTSAVLLHAFYAIVRTIVLAVSRYYKRRPGRQLDHNIHPDSRKLRISDLAKSIALKRI